MEDKKTEFGSQVDAKNLDVDLTKLDRVVIYLKPDPSFDEMVSSLALGQFFETNGKTVRIICPNLPEYLKSIQGAEKVEADFGSPTLVISFAYTEGDIEKISYKVEEGRFNLIINSRSGLETENLKFENRINEFDLLCFVGVSGEASQSLIADNTLLSKVQGLENKSRSFVKQGDKSIAEQLVWFFAGSNLPVDPKTAELLFSGLKSVTSNFANPVYAAAFEAAAQCVRWIKKEDGAGAPESWLAPKIYKGSTIVE